MEDHPEGTGVMEGPDPVVLETVAVPEVVQA